MTLTFRQRIFAVLLVLGAVPTTLVLVGWALTLRRGDSGQVNRAAVAEIGRTGRTLLETIDSTKLSHPERVALAEHARAMNTALSRVQQYEAYSRLMSAALTVVILVLGGLILYGGARLAGHLSRQLSRPIDELVGWTGHILRREPLPPDQARKGAPEFTALRTALRELSDRIGDARERELEAERLRSFREVARRVAHEMKNPLTPMRFAVTQLQRSAGDTQREALEVLQAESARLEQLAREFAEFGRLPEGPPADVDLNELLAELVRTSVPPGADARIKADPATPRVTGHYDPLRRAFSNILRNAVEATGGRGPVRVSVAPADGGATVRISDRGPGVRAADRQRIFQPYVTTKSEGTGLGLAMVRQTVEAHGGRVWVEDTPGGGATFVVELPRERPPATNDGRAG
ncbi:MAG TPA: HAMP domain-containing sensor histidine kinase [Gemmatimonadales bacterium]|nr:HAMP domain-containing sensor histidine kinase [Gemmatimonadales bacterium]